MRKKVRIRAENPEELMEEKGLYLYCGQYQAESAYPHRRQKNPF